MELGQWANATDRETIFCAVFAFQQCAHRAQ